MLGKISEVTKTTNNTDASDEYSLPEHVSEKAKHKKHARLEGMDSGLVTPMQLATEKYCLASGGPLLAENQGRRVSANKPQTVAVSASAKETGLSAGTKLPASGALVVHPRGTANLKGQMADGLSLGTLPGTVHQKTTRHGHQTEQSAHAGNGIKTLKPAHVLTGSGVSILNHNDAVTAAPVFREQTPPDRARQQPHGQDLKLSQASVDSATQQQQTARLNTQQAVDSQAASNAEQSAPSADAMLQSKSHTQDLPPSHAKPDAAAPQLQTAMLNREPAADSQTASTAAHARPSTTAMLQSKMRAQATASSPGSHSLELEYKFRRWSGDHSVKVSVPAETGRDGNLTLLPSGSRAADALTSQFVHLTGHTPKLLDPQRDDHEQPQRQREDAQDEEQE